RIACVVTRRAVESLEILDPSAGTLERLDLPFTAYTGWSIAEQDGRLVTIAATETDGSAVVTIDVDSGECEVVKRELEHEIDTRYISRPEPIAFPGDGGESYGFFYSPVNPEFVAPEGE